MSVPIGYEAWSVNGRAERRDIELWLLAGKFAPRPGLIGSVRLVRVSWGDKERRETKGKGLLQCIERVN